MKKWIIRGAIVAVVLVVVMVVAAFLSINKIVKTGFETIGPKITQVEMKLDSANISPFSGSGQLTGLFIGNPEGYKTPSAIKMGDIKVAVNIGSVTSDVIEINSVEIIAPEITMEGSLKGSNLTKILANVQAFAGPADKSEKAPADDGSGKKFKVKDIVIDGGKVNVSLTVMGGKSVTVPLPKIHLQNIGTDTGGVTIAQLTEEILKPVFASVAQVATQAIGSVGEGVKDAGKGAVDTLEKTGKGLKDLFKKE